MLDNQVVNNITLPNRAQKDNTLDQVQQQIGLNQSCTNPYILQSSQSQVSQSQIEIYKRKSRHQNASFGFESENFTFKNEYMAIDQSTFSNVPIISKEESEQPIQIYNDSFTHIQEQNCPDEPVIKLIKVPKKKSGRYLDKIDTCSNSRSRSHSSKKNSRVEAEGTGASFQIDKAENLGASTEMISNA